MSSTNPKQFLVEVYICKIYLLTVKYFEEISSLQKLILAIATLLSDIQSTAIHVFFYKQLHFGD